MGGSTAAGSRTAGSEDDLGTRAGLAKSVSAVLALTHPPLRKATQVAWVLRHSTHTPKNRFRIRLHCWILLRMNFPHWTRPRLDEKMWDGWRLIGSEKECRDWGGGSEAEDSEARVERNEECFARSEKSVTEEQKSD